MIRNDDLAVSDQDMKIVLKSYRGKFLSTGFKWDEKEDFVCGRYGH